MKITEPFHSGYLNLIKSLLPVMSSFILTLLLNTHGMAQDKNQMVRLAKIKVDPSQLENYNVALKEQMTTAIQVEPGVLTYYAVADKSDPTNITILEIYADTAAYNLHVANPILRNTKKQLKTW